MGGSSHEYFPSLCLLLLRRLLLHPLLHSQGLVQLNKDDRDTGQQGGGDEEAGGARDDVGVVVDGAGVERGQREGEGGGVRLCIKKRYKSLSLFPSLSLSHLSPTSWPPLAPSPGPSPPSRRIRGRSFGTQRRRTLRPTPGGRPPTARGPS